MANLDNLRTPTTEEARKIGAKGGIASGKARREKKAMKDTLAELLTMPLENGALDNLEEIQSIAEMNGKSISVQEAIMLAQIRKAVEGDTKAAEYIRDTSGQKPSDKMNIEHEGIIRSEKLDDIIRQIGGEGLTE